ncbi:transcriptional regulator, DeoR family [Jatrophihabitans endophyticus]|uniref:Transcriptional regulator, DeoR family n=1 Tax=Jatrophihabitans endophyticus TaxID=1206085 RepID=A0A1M5U4J5_9ACTN|nr:DeoR/GlpR family DNA-binding transcription regulator [Jatrophihabitans endophyticus]SHH57603.1 transcriptional regulator, DeoR family [Jatrophihabitans endophyticus]
MLVPDRRRRVLEHVHREGTAQVEHLARLLGVSAWTVRRDLAELEARGLLRRARGGAYVESATDPAGAPAGEGEDRAAAEGVSADVKARIGARAAQQLPDGATIMVLAGSTTGALLPHLVRRRLTVVTNGLEIAHGLRHAADVSVLLLGGYLHRDQMTLLGPLTEANMADLHVDVIVAGAYGVHPAVGVTGAKIIQAGYQHGMLRHTDALMVLADASKLGRRGPTVLASLDDVDTLVTDSAAAPEIVEQVSAAGVDVLVAE